MQCAVFHDHIDHWRGLAPIDCHNAVFDHTGASIGVVANNPRKINSLTLLYDRDLPGIRRAIGVAPFGLVAASEAALHGVIIGAFLGLRKGGGGCEGEG